MDSINTSESETETEDRGRLLRQAALRGDLEAVRALLERRERTEAAGERGAVLPDDPVPPDAPDGKGFTALMLAAKYGYAPIVRLLCERGADPSRRNDFHCTALSYAAQNRQADAAVVLLEHGASRASESDFPWHQPMYVALSFRDEPMVRALLDHGTYYDRSPEALGNLLFQAAWAGEPFVRLLLERGADAAVQRHDGSTPLMEAAEQGNIDCLRLLFAAGSPVNARGDRGKTALMYAARTYQDRDMLVRLLLDFGAEVAAADKDGRTALFHCALGYGIPRLERGDTESTEERAFRLLLERGSDPKTRDAWGWELLHVIPSGRCARWLLDAGVDREARDDENRTPLLRAARETHLETVRVLLEAGADALACDRRGLNALSHARIALLNADARRRGRKFPDDEEAPRLEAIIGLLIAAGALEQEVRDLAGPEDAWLWEHPNATLIG